MGESGRDGSNRTDGTNERRTPYDAASTAARGQTGRLPYKVNGARKYWRPAVDPGARSGDRRTTRNGPRLTTRLQRKRHGRRTYNKICVPTGHRISIMVGCGMIFERLSSLEGRARSTHPFIPSKEGTDGGNRTQRGGTGGARAPLYKVLLRENASAVALAMAEPETKENATNAEPEGGGTYFCETNPSIRRG